jgi:AbrB family looped-hinge helix DNA binding protein
MATISEDYNIEIPKSIRDALGLRPGQKVDFIRVGNTFRLVRLKGIESLRGILKGADLSDYRDEDDRL